jgi:hypothetical protein
MTMPKFLPVLAFAAFAATSAFSATVTLTNGGAYTFAQGDDYLFSSPIAASGKAGKVSFTFLSDNAALPFILGATAGSIKMAGNLVTPTLSWSVGKTIVEAMALTPSYTGASITGYNGSLNSMFPKGSQAQTLTLNWSKVTGSTFLAVAVAAVPLPAGLLMLAAAIGALLALRRRRATVAA